jgi:hypothetical protein
MLGACGTPPSPPKKVVLVGIDGADWAIVDELRAAGRMPALGRLIDAGAHGSLATLRPTLSPALWTTVATGEAPATHGVENFVLFRPEATILLPALPAGDLDLLLRATVEPPCARESLVVRVDGTALAGTWDRGNLRIRLPPGGFRERTHVVLGVPARCAAPPAAGAAPKDGGPPWGSLGGLSVARTSGEVVVEQAPAALVGAGTGVRAGSAPDAPALLVGRRLAQVESGDRRVPALWNIASARGRSVGVIGWWCTWPAERVNGTIVSDFLFFASTRRLLDLEQMPADAIQERAVYPPDAMRLLADAMPTRWELTAAELGRFVPATSPHFAEYLAAPARVRSLGDAPLTMLKDTYLINRPYFVAARRLAQEAQPDLLLVYTNLVDAVEHKFWRYREPARFPGTPADEVEDFGPTIARSYEYVDAELGDLLAAIDPTSVVIVISDHGHHAASNPSGVFSGEHSDAPPGVLVAAGPGIRHGEVHGASLYDMAPTVLALLGLPLADDMPGRPPAELFATPPSGERVPTYRDLPHETAPAPATPEIDPAVRERLRALGYLQ